MPRERGKIHTPSLPPVVLAQLRVSDARLVLVDSSGNDLNVTRRRLRTRRRFERRRDDGEYCLRFPWRSADGAKPCGTRRTGAWYGGTSEFSGPRTFWPRGDGSGSEEEITGDCLPDQRWRVYAGCGMKLRHVSRTGRFTNLACRDDAYAKPIEGGPMFGLALLGCPVRGWKSYAPLRLYREACGPLLARRVAGAAPAPDAFVEEPWRRCWWWNGCCGKGRPHALRPRDNLQRRSLKASCVGIFGGAADCNPPVPLTVLHDALLPHRPPSASILLVDFGRPHSRGLGVPVGGRPRIGPR